MSQDVKPTRRAMLAGAAAIPTTALPAAALAAMPLEPDPIFAAIEAHRARWSEFNAWCALPEAGTEEGKAAENRLSDAEWEAAIALVEIEPTTMAGVIALLRYTVGVNECGWPDILMEKGVENSHGRSWEYFLRCNLAGALERIAVAS
jgi:hypothetical protein